MPYVITTHTADEAMKGTFYDVRVTHRAVATLDELRRDLRFAVSEAYTAMHPYTHGTDWSPWSVKGSSAERDFADEFPETGGTIGPLPDGTVIEVQRIRDDEMRFELRMARGTSTPFRGEATIIDAYNALHAA